MAVELEASVLLATAWEISSPKQRLVSVPMLFT